MTNAPGKSPLLLIVYYLCTATTTATAVRQMSFLNSKDPSGQEQVLFFEIKHDNFGVFVLVLNPDENTFGFDEKLFRIFNLFDVFYIPILALSLF